MGPVAAVDRETPAIAMRFARCFGLVPASLACALPPLPAFKNGIGLYVPQLRRLVLKYCDRGGSSRGLVEFLHTKLPEYANAHKHIEFVVLARPGRHPLARGLYINGREKTLCLRNLKADEIPARLRLITDFHDAATPHRVSSRVVSTTPAVRGIWTPFKRAA